MAWIYLVLAGLFEVLFVFSMGKARETIGRQSFLWYTLFVIAFSLSMWLMMKATKTLPLGTAYAVWTGIGAVGSVAVGMLFFQRTHNSLACSVSGDPYQLHYRTETNKLAIINC